MGVVINGNKDRIHGSKEATKVGSRRVRKAVGMIKAKVEATKAGTKAKVATKVGAGTRVKVATKAGIKAKTKVALVSVGEPSLELRKKVQEINLQEKQEASDREFRVKLEEEKKKRAREKREREVERAKKRAEKEAG